MPKLSAARNFSPLISGTLPTTSIPLCLGYQSLCLRWQTESHGHRNAYYQNDIILLHYHFSLRLSIFFAICRSSTVKLYVVKQKYIVSHKALFFFDIIKSLIYVSESLGYILTSAIQKKGESTYYTKYFSIFVLNIITLYPHIGITIIKQSIELS